MQEKIKKPNYTKLVTDSDIDGIVCAAMLLRVFPDLKVTFSSPSDVQDDAKSLKIDENTIISDLPYSKACGLYFDHHISNKPKTKIPGMWKVAPSAARVIFEYYRKKVPLTDFEDILPELDMFDSGMITREAIENPSFYLKLFYATKKIKHKFYKHIVELLVEEGPTALYDDMEIVSEIGEFEKSLALMKQDIHNTIEKFNDIIFIKLIDKPYSNIHVSLLQYEFLDSKVFVLFMKDMRAVRVTLFDNNLDRNSKRYNLLSVASKMNPAHSGGHRSGCGFTMPEGMTIEECVVKLKMLIGKLF